MDRKHADEEHYSITQYTKMQRLLHHRILLEQQQQNKIHLPMAAKLAKKVRNATLSKSDSDTGSTNSMAGSGSSENSSESSSDDDLSMDDYYFLQPVPTRQRRIMLRQAGIKKIDTEERDLCKEIRGSREVCGCDCKVVCDPETCICSLAGIKCQVDRLAFPCGCSKEGCKNKYGRIEFNPIRVRTHFIHTLMRLELEKKQADQHSRKQQVKVNNSAGMNSHTHSSAAQEKRSSNGSQINGHNDSRPHVEDFNSTEMGSCRDCQKGELSDILMREPHFPPSAAELDTCHSHAPPANRNFCQNIVPEENQMGLPTVTNPGESLPQVMLFSDDEEAYNAENTTMMYQFPKEDSSYSESSDCSSEGSTPPEDPQGQFPNFQSLAPYDIIPGSGGGEETMNHAAPDSQDFPNGPCQNNNFGPTPAQPEQKYLDLSGPMSSYKLEPISEILNPLRFPSYPNHIQNGPGWTPEPNYCQYPTRSLQDEGTPSASSMTSADGEVLGSYPQQCTSLSSALTTPTCSADTQSQSQDLSSFSSTVQSKPMAGEMLLGSQSPPQANIGVNGRCGQTGSVSSSTMASNSASNSSSLCDASLSSCPVTAGHNQTNANYRSSQYFNQNDALPAPSCTPPSYSLSHENEDHCAGEYQTMSEYDANSAVASTPMATEKEDDDKPQYYELKSSTKKSVTSLGSFKISSTSNQGAASFEMCNQSISSSVPSLHSTQSCGQVSSTDGISDAAPSDLFSFPLAQKVEPVSNFEMPNEKEKRDEKKTTTEKEPASPSTEQASTTQNFGEMIKESIVETVSA